MRNRILLRGLWCGFVLLSFVTAGCLTGNLHKHVHFPVDWWPAQSAPTTFISVANPSTQGEQNLLQALSGFAARAVNESRGHELVWKEVDSANFSDWQKRTVSRLSLVPEEKSDVWALLDSYTARGWVKGYVIYRTAGGKKRSVSEEIDKSVNVATTLAGLMDAVPVDEAMEDRVVARGLKKLADARDLSMEKALQLYRDQCNRSVVCLLNPSVDHMRDIAVANRAFVGYGTNTVTDALLAWSDPLAPVLGWGQGDEFKHTAPISRKGHFHTVSDNAQNLSFLSAGAGEYEFRKIKPMDPRTIDWNDKRRCLAFMMSDGDNLAFMLDGIWSRQYMGHPSHGAFPMGWSACLSDLAQVAPVVIDRLNEIKPPQTTYVQFGGGYFYPDLFAADCINRMELLRAHAKRIGAQMQRSGATVLCCIMSTSDTPEAQEALRVLAEEIHPLLGVMVMDYAPYNRMQGRVYWIKDGRGDEVPVITARYCMWGGMKAKRAGAPEEIAKWVNDDAKAQLDPQHSWVAVHAWSRHRNPATGVEESGLEPVRRCVDSLDTGALRVVSPEELLWRLRMTHDPKGTRAAVESLQKKE